MFLPPLLTPVHTIVVGYLDRHECHYFDDDRHLSSIAFASHQQTKDIIHRHIRCDKSQLQQKCVSSLELFHLLEWNLFGDIHILSMIARTACIEVLDDCCERKLFHHGKQYNYYQQQFDLLHFEYWRSKGKLTDSNIFSHLLIFHEFEEAQDYWPCNYLFPHLDYAMVIWLQTTNKIIHIPFRSYYHYSIDVIRILVDVVPEPIHKQMMYHSICHIRDPDIFNILKPWATPSKSEMMIALESGSLVAVKWLIQNGFVIDNTLYLLLAHFSTHELDDLLPHLNPDYFHGLPIYKPTIVQWLIDHSGTPMQQTEPHMQCVMEECELDDLQPLWRIMKWKLNEKIIHCIARMCNHITHVHKLCVLLKMVKQNIRFPISTNFKFFECTEMIRLALAFRCGPLPSFHIRYLQPHASPLVQQLLQQKKK